MALDLVSSVRSVPDFPKKGIVFRDITTLLKDPVAFSTAVELMADHYKSRRIDKIISVESRGFIFGAPLACKLKIGFVPVRKPGKLPADVLREEYQLEYGTDAIEIHKDSISSGDHVLLVDDLLATGGTILAASKLVERLGGNIMGLAFLIELTFLNARTRLGSYDVFSIIKYDKE